jgi:mono/diheme cytochrome c family protein
MPKWLRYTIVLSILASWIPLALIARARFTISDRTPLHVFLDMDQQAKFKAQQAGPKLEDGSPLFADGRAMRPAIEGTVARSGAASYDDHYFTGKLGGEPAAGFPDSVNLTRELLERGRQRFEIYCAPCHGAAGYGDGLVSLRADRLQEGTWTPPASFHTDVVRERPEGHIFDAITNGIRNMPAYGPQIPVEDRWAIVAYVRALQRSQNATLDEVPLEAREALR